MENECNTDEEKAARVLAVRNMANVNLQEIEQIVYSFCLHEAREAVKDVSDKELGDLVEYYNENLDVHKQNKHDHQIH